MRQRLVFVTALGHSGSTMLDLILGGHPKIVGLGEVFTTIELWDKQTQRCTCGAEPQVCPIWGPAMAPWKRRTVDVEAAYRGVMSRVREVYGDDHIALDTSKLLPSLERVTNFWEGELDVLFLIRDVRGFVTSTRKYTAHRVGALGRSTLLRTAQWYVTNRRIERFLQERQLRYLQLGYEELCFHTDATLARIGEFLEILPPTAEGLRNSGSHIMRGNRMRDDDRRRGAIEYDSRWFRSLRSQLAARLWPPIWHWNQTHTYGNVSSSGGSGRGSSHR